MNPKNFFAELKRRNVYKVAIAYAVVAWLLMQIARRSFRSSRFQTGQSGWLYADCDWFSHCLVIAWAFEPPRKESSARSLRTNCRKIRAQSAPGFMSSSSRGDLGCFVFRGALYRAK